MELLIILCAFAMLPLSAYGQNNTMLKSKAGCPAFHKEAHQLLKKFLTNNKAYFIKKRNKLKINHLSTTSVTMLKGKKERAVCQQIHKRVFNRLPNGLKAVKPSDRDFFVRTYYQSKDFYFVASAYNPHPTIVMEDGPLPHILILNKQFQPVETVTFGKSIYVQKNTLSKRLNLGCPDFHKKTHQLLKRFLTSNEAYFIKKRNELKINHLSTTSVTMLKGKKERAVCEQIHKQLLKRLSNALKAMEPRGRGFFVRTYFQSKDFYFVVRAFNPNPTIIGDLPSPQILILNKKFQPVGKVTFGNIYIHKQK